MNDKSKALVVPKSSSSSSKKKITFSDFEKYENAIEVQEEVIENSDKKIDDIEEELKKLMLLEKEINQQEKEIAKQLALEKKREQEEKRKEALARKKEQERLKKEAQLAKKKEQEARRKELLQQKKLEQKRKQEELALLRKQQALEKKQQRQNIPLDQKHTIVSVQDYEGKYNYDLRRKEWHQKAGHNAEQLVCSGCKDDDNWETILLDDGRHICYYCWVKKPKNANAPRINRAGYRTLSIVKTTHRREQIPQIQEGQKHKIVKLYDFQNNYNYHERRLQWYKYAGHNDVNETCWMCNNKENPESILLDIGKHVCYFCWIKKPENWKRKSEYTPIVVKKTPPKPEPKIIDYEVIYKVELDTLRTAFQVLPKPIQLEYEKNIYKMVDRLIELKFIEKKH